MLAILDYWNVFIMVYPAVAIMLRGIAEGLIAIGKVMNKPDVTNMGTSIGAFLIALGKVVGYFGIGTPSASKTP